MSETSDETRSRVWTKVLFGTFLLAPGFDAVYKYFGLGGITIYILTWSVVTFAFLEYLWPAARNRLTEKNAIAIAFAIFAILIIYVFGIYDLANNGYFGPGSDANDALITSANEFLNGRYPYYKSTYLGNPIAPLPGAMFMVIPWVFINLVELQNVFWLGVFFFVFRFQFKSYVPAVGLLAIMLVCSPSIFANLATGTDHISNTGYVLTAIWLMIRKIPDANASTAVKIMSAIFLGIGLSSRSNFLFLLPLVFAMIAGLSNWRIAAAYLGLTCAVTLAVTFPFYLYDPAGFAPYNLQMHKMNQFNSILPQAGLILTATALALSGTLAFKQKPGDLASFFRYCAFVQAYAILFTSILHSILTGTLSIYFGHIGYGLFVMFFGAFGQWIALSASQKSETTLA